MDYQYSEDYEHLRDKGQSVLQGSPWLLNDLGHV